jgi:hypothetical protein
MKAYMFVDRSDAKLEFVYVIGADGIFARSIEFPGYSKSQFFFRAHLPDRVAGEALRWEGHDGEIKPPFIPDGPWFSKLSIPASPDEPAKEVYFKDENQALRKWLLDLRGELINANNAVTQPPDWVSSDPRIQARLGLPK